MPPPLRLFAPYLRRKPFVTDAPQKDKSPLGTLPNNHMTRKNIIHIWIDGYQIR